MVGADSHGISRAPWYSGPATVHLCNFSFTRLSLSVAIRSKIIQLNYIQSTGLLYKSTSPSHNTTITTHTGLHNNGLGSSRFAHHYLGNHFVFFSWPYLDVSVRAVRSCYPIYSDRCNTVLLYWVSPFGNLRINARLTAPRSVSQSSASFIASWYQGIHQILLKINHKLRYSFSNL